VLNDGTEHGEELLSEKRREVAVGGVDPAIDEVVIAVGEPLSLREQFLSTGIVEFGSDLFLEREPDNVEVSSLGLLDPCSERSSVDSKVRPVLVSLGFNDVKTVVEVKCHGTVT